MKRKSFIFLALILAILTMAGCATTKILPYSRQSTESPWSSYKAAEKVCSTIEQGQTMTEIRQKKGIDPKIMPNITIINDEDIRNTYLPNPSIKIEYLPKGVQECIQAKDNCFGWDIEVGGSNSDRTGGFWMDTLGIKRKETKTSWKFKQRILWIKTQDDNNGDSAEAKVVFVAKPKGNPFSKENIKTVKPLGPLQTAGEQAIKFGVDNAF